METHPNRALNGGQEIRCEDCGNLYAIAAGQQSSQCPRCNSIQLHGYNANPLVDIIRNKVLEKIHPPSKEEQYFRTFQAPADGLKVQEILSKYQLEWQLWAQVTKHFSDPNFHAAYLSHTASTLDFSMGAKRYREHRSVMLLLSDEKWQADIADQMIARLEAVAIVRMQEEGRSTWLPDFIYLLPVQGRIFRMGFFLFGFYFIFQICMKYLMK